MRKLSEVFDFSARQVNYEEINPTVKTSETAAVVSLEADELQGGEGWKLSGISDKMNVYLDEY